MSEEIVIIIIDFLFFMGMWFLALYMWLRWYRVTKEYNSLNEEHNSLIDEYEEQEERIGRQRSKEELKNDRLKEEIEERIKKFTVVKKENYRLKEENKNMANDINKFFKEFMELKKKI